MGIVTTTSGRPVPAYSLLTEEMAALAVGIILTIHETRESRMSPSAVDNKNLVEYSLVI